MQRKQRREENVFRYGTNIPSREQKDAYADEQKRASKQEAAHAAGFRAKKEDAEPAPVTGTPAPVAPVAPVTGTPASASASAAPATPAWKGSPYATPFGGPTPPAPALAVPPSIAQPKEGPVSMADRVLRLYDAPPDTSAHTGIPVTADQALARDSKEKERAFRQRENGIAAKVEKQPIQSNEDQHAEVIRQVREMSKGENSPTREAALDLINKGRVQSGKAPLKLDWKDVAAVDRGVADREQKAKRDASAAAKKESDSFIDTLGRKRASEMLGGKTIDLADAAAAGAAEGKKEAEKAKRDDLMAEIDRTLRGSQVVIDAATARNDAAAARRREEDQKMQDRRRSGARGKTASPYR